METDLQLVGRMLRGEEDAFERFFDAMYPALHRFALARLDFNPDAAADVAQAAICKAIRKLHTYRGEAALLTWLSAFCRHELYDWTRRRGRLDVELLEDDPEVRAALESLRSADADDLDAALDRRRVALLVQRALDHLPPRYADALELKYIDGFTVQEIAVRLDVGAKAVESLLTRARRAFREAFHNLNPAWTGLDRREGQP
jgi:RNA polymerase sigma-70 factor (ECF subfamily)